MKSPVTPSATHYFKRGHKHNDCTHSNAHSHTSGTPVPPVTFFPSPSLSLSTPVIIIVINLLRDGNAGTFGGTLVAAKSSGFGYTLDPRFWKSGAHDIGTRSILGTVENYTRGW